MDYPLQLAQSVGSRELCGTIESSLE